LDGKNQLKRNQANPTESASGHAFNGSEDGEDKAIRKTRPHAIRGHARESCSSPEEQERVNLSARSEAAMPKPTHAHS